MTLRSELGVPESATTVVCRDVALAVSRHGKGVPIVCLHAIAHGGRDFEVFERLAADLGEIVRIDWPGHGRSENDTQPPDPWRYAELLEDLLPELGITNPVLIGNSIGGAAAIVYASRNPVSALVLCDPGGLVPVWLPVRLLTSLMSRFFAAGLSAGKWFDKAFSVYYRRLVLPHPNARAQRERIISTSRLHAGLLSEAWAGFGQPEADLRELAAGIPAPIWCAWSQQDRVIPLWMCKPAIKRMKNASLTLFQGGHAAFLEEPEAFAQGLRSFKAACQQH